MLDGALHIDQFQEATTLSDVEKRAFRYLLYCAMLDIRILCQSRGRVSWNPFAWRRQYLQSRMAGALADWLHNLALHATGDFERFDKDLFWREYDGLTRRFDQIGFGRWMDYGKRYADHLEELKFA